MEELLREFRQKLTYERIHGSNQYEEEIIKCYYKILEYLIIDYPTYRKYIPVILDSLEQNKIKSISYSQFVFDKLYRELMKQNVFTEFNNSITKIKPSEGALDNFKLIFETNLKSNSFPRLSGALFDTCNLSVDNKKELVSLIIDKLQFDAVKLVWTEEIVESNLMCLYPLKALTSGLNDLSLFYLPSYIFLDHLCLSEFHQQARNFAEELLICSFNDSCTEYGFFTAFRIYSNQNSVHAAYLYGILTLFSLSRKKSPFLDKLIQEIIWQTLKFYRNVKLPLFIDNYYKIIPTSINFSPYHKRALDQTYLSSKMQLHEPQFPQTFLNYLHKERESIIQGGISDCLPWLVMIYNLKRVYPDADFSPYGFGFYLSIFEQIVPEETVKRYKNIINGSVLELKNYLKESYIKLTETANISDVEYDNETALKIANRLVVTSFNESDFEAMLLLMIFKSDYSLIHSSKNTAELVQFKIPDLNTDKVFEYYRDKDVFYDELHLNDTIEIIWLYKCEGELFQSSFFNKTFHFHKLSDWNEGKYIELKQSHFFSSFTFEFSLKDKYGMVYAISPEEYLDQSELLIKEISFSKTIDFSSKSLLLIKDMEISEFPHNLLLNQSSEFLFLQKPITNILSTEWYIINNNSTSLNNSYSKSVWIPTEGLDSTLNYLFSNIEDCLLDNNFEIIQSLNLSNPLSSEVNIISSHGSSDISQNQVIFPTETPLFNLNKVIGSGKILILFVCHSGSQSNDFFKNGVSSLVKEFISQGYQSIIAPAWALRVDVPPIWLPIFLESLNRGEVISVAHHKANLAVYEKFPTPAAWACLHLFGNPNLKIAD